MHRWIALLSGRGEQARPDRLVERLAGTASGPANGARSHCSKDGSSAWRRRARARRSSAAGPNSLARTEWSAATKRRRRRRVEPEPLRLRAAPGCQPLAPHAVAVPNVLFEDADRETGTREHGRERAPADSGTDDRDVRVEHESSYSRVRAAAGKREAAPTRAASSGLRPNEKRHIGRRHRLGLPSRRPICIMPAIPSSGSLDARAVRSRRGLLAPDVARRNGAVLNI
jgi:hypothetical protein